MGLLGDFGNFIKTPEGQGLLSAAFGGMAGARPGQPWNTAGRAGLAGLLGYQNAQENQQQQELLGIKTKAMQEELAEKQRIADFYKNVGQFQTSPVTDALSAGAKGGSIGPTVANAGLLDQMPPPQFDASAMYRAMLSSGSPTLAQAGMAGMVKEKPKVKDWQKVNVDGKVLYAPYFEDGTVGQPVPYQVAEKLHFANTGGATVGMDQFTGKPVATVKNTMSPDAAASNAIGWANVGLRKQEIAQKDREIGSGGKPPAGYRFKMDGTLEAIPGGPADKVAAASEGERKAATLLKRLEGSMTQLNTALQQNPDAAKPGVVASGLKAIGAEALSNKVTGEERQRIEAAQLDMLDAALTLGTGAAYTKEQLEGYRKSYFPQIGDAPATIRDKEARLKNVIDAAKIAAGRAASQASPVAPQAIKFLGFE